MSTGSLPTLKLHLFAIVLVYVEGVKISFLARTFCALCNISLGRKQSGRELRRSGRCYEIVKVYSTRFVRQLIISSRLGFVFSTGKVIQRLGFGIIQMYLFRLSVLRKDNAVTGFNYIGNYVL